MGTPHLFSWSSAVAHLSGCGDQIGEVAPLPSLMHDWDKIGVVSLDFLSVIHPNRPLKKSPVSWIPAFAGMTTGENVPFFVIPAKAGIQKEGATV